MLTPHPYQQTAIDHHVAAFQRHQAVVNGSDGGCGKTLIAVETVRRLGDPATVVVCPAGVKSSWRRHSELQGIGLEITNYERMYHGSALSPLGNWRWPKNSKIVAGRRTGRPRWYWSDEVEMVIFDEAHRCMGMDSQTMDLMRACRRQNKKCLALSATIADSPTEMNALGYVLGLHDSDDPATLGNPTPRRFTDWLVKQGCYYGLQGWEFGGSDESRQQKMAKLHAEIYPEHGLRLRNSELPDFPESQLTAELYSVAQPGRLDALYEQMRSALEQLHQRKVECGDTENNPLTSLLRAAQEAELLKVPVFVELARDGVASGRSVAIFVNYRQTMREICDKLQTDCRIDGSQVGPRGLAQREHNRQRFQSGLSRVIVCIMAAGGVGLDLHDLTGEFPRETLLSPGFNAKLFKQAIFRVHRIGARSKSIQRVVLLDGSVELKTHRKLGSKLGNLDALNDGDLTPWDDFTEISNVI